MRDVLHPALFPLAIPVLLLQKEGSNKERTPSLFFSCFSVCCNIKYFALEKMKELVLTSPNVFQRSSVLFPGIMRSVLHNTVNKIF